MKKFYDKYSWLITLAFAVGFVYFCFKNCKGEIKPINPIDFKPEIKAQDSLKNVVDSLDKVSRISVQNALKSDSVANHYLGRYRFYKSKFLSKQDSTPCGTEIRFLASSCDSVIAQDSIRDLAWKEVHKNDSTENSALKNLTRIQDIISIKKDTIIRQKTDSIHDLTKKLKWQKLKTKGVIALWLAREAVGIAQKIKN